MSDSKQGWRGSLLQQQKMPRTTNLTASLFTSQLWFSLGNVSKVYPMHSSLNFQVEMINLKDVKPTKSQHNCQPLVVTTLEEIKRNFPSCQL